MVIQVYLLNAPAVYTELETGRVDLAEQVAGAVSARFVALHPPGVQVYAGQL